MSSSELTEAGVLGLDDSRSAGSEAKASEADTSASYSRPDLLTELKEIHVLDELIIEENLKIHELRSSQEKPNNHLSGSKTLDTNDLSNVSEERETFRLQIEKEEREVVKLERSLDKDGANKIVKGRTRRVVKCSSMEKARAGNEEDQALCEELLSNGSDGEQRTCSASLDQEEEVEAFKAEGGSNVKEATPNNVVPPCQDLTGSEASLMKSTLDVEEQSVEVGIKPQRCIDAQELFGYGADPTKTKPEASLTPEMKPDDGAFDPGGKSILPPVPQPRNASLSLNNLADQTPHSPEPLHPGLSSHAQHLGFVQPELQDKAPDCLPENASPAESRDFVLHPNVKEHGSNNNNNNLRKKRQESEMSSEDKVAPVCLNETTLHPTTEIRSLSDCLAPGQPLEFDPGGRDDAMRVSGPASPGIQAQPNGNVREVSRLCLFFHFCSSFCPVGRNFFDSNVFLSFDCRCLILRPP